MTGKNIPSHPLSHPLYPLFLSEKRLPVTEGVTGVTGVTGKKHNPPPTNHFCVYVVYPTHKSFISTIYLFLPCHICHKTYIYIISF